MVASNTPGPVRTRPKGPSARTTITVLLACVLALGLVFVVYRLIAGREVFVPNLSLVSLEQAREDVANAGLVMGTVSEVATRGPAPGRIIGQSPAGGTSVSKGTAVDVTVAAALTVPDVIGMPEAEAREEIAAVRMKSRVFPAYSDSVPSGTVVDQLPHVGAAARSNAVLFVSIGAGKGVGIPDVTGLTRSQATSVLSRRGLRPVWISGNADEGPGTVLDQAPAATTKVPKDSYVGVMINMNVE